MTIKKINILVTNEPGKHLGFHLSCNGCGNRNFKEVMEKFDMKLASRKARIFSVASHLTLIKFVLSSITMYNI